MSQAAVRQQRASALEPELVRDLGETIAHHLYDGDEPLSDAPVIRAQLARIVDADRRREVELFIRNVDDELGVAAAARRDFAVAVHPVQVSSKLWLIDELGRHCDLAASSLLVLGGWYGILPLLVNWRLSVPPSRMVCIDNDPAVGEAGRRIIGALYANVEYRCKDAMDLDYTSAARRESPIVINTICEHLPDVGRWWSRLPTGQLVALQNNNYRACPDHVSAVESLEEFKRQVPGSEVLFEGVLNLPPWLDRYMLIGRR
jgi:hypothetical protein